MKRTRAPSPSTLRKAAARAAVAQALAHERQVQSTRRIQARELRATCAARRVELREARKARDAELRAEKKRAIAELRAEWTRRIDEFAQNARRAAADLRTSCTPDRAAARAELRELRAAVERARAERAAALAAARKPPRGGVRSMNIAERRAHELAEAQANFHEPWERALLAELFYKNKLRAGPRRSLSEAFNEWLVENASKVYPYIDRFYASQAADYERQQSAAYELRDASRVPPGASSSDFGYWGE